MDIDIIKNVQGEVSAISMDSMPEHDLFLSELIEFLNSSFPGEKFTGNIIQNYIKSEVLTKPFQGRKRGYTRMHVIQMVLLSYMRPVLTTEDIKKVFALAFNDINNQEDDIITWEEAYRIFTAIYESIYSDVLTGEEAEIDEYLKPLNLDESNLDRIKSFITVLILVTRSSSIKRKVRQILDK
ncbi:MAG: DUF1836 domain-containing protein [Clostridiaceae bacterium]